MSLVAYNNRFNDSRAAKTVFTDVGASFSASQPLENMAKKQLPLFAQFDVDCEFDVEAVVDSDDSAPTLETFSADVFALLGHTLDDGMEVEFLNGSNSLGTVTVANYQGLPQHVILAIDSAVTMDTLTVKVTGGESGSSYRIGSVWAGPSFRTAFGLSDFSIETRSLSDQAWAAATGYSNERESQRLVSVRFPYMTKAEAKGPSWPNWEAITMSQGRHSPMIVIPDTNEMAFSVYGLVDTYPLTRPFAEDSYRGGIDLLESR